MRRIYLVRHGDPEHGEEDRCIGRTDPALSPQGEAQGRRLAHYFADKALTEVYSSPSRRAQETAAMLSAGRWPVLPHEGLWELDMGEWDGMAVQRIQEKHAAYYARFEADPENNPPPGGERLSQGQSRFCHALEELLASSQGDIAVVAHPGVIRLLLCKIRELPVSCWTEFPQPGGCLNLLWEVDGRLSIEETGRMPEAWPDDEECLVLLDKYAIPERAVEHCRMVAERAGVLVRALAQGGLRLDAGLVRAGALLHDIARREPDRAQIAARRLRAEGYPLVAEVVETHLDLSDPERVDEAAVLYLAHKLVQDGRRVTLSERFAASRENCRDPVTLAAHEAQYKQALAVQRAINAIVRGTEG